MANTTLNQFLQEQSLVAGVVASGMQEELAEQQANGEWSDALTADELLEALQSDSTVQKM